MTVYSNSRLSTFEQCPQKFKFHYMDKVETDVEEAIIDFAEKDGHNVIFRSNNQVKIKTTTRYACPSKHSKEREELEKLLREQGKWDDVAQLNTTAINKIIQEKKWDSELLDVLKTYVKLEQSKRLYSSGIKNG